TLLAAAAMLASRERPAAAVPDHDGEGARPGHAEFGPVFAEFMVAAATLTAESDVTQLDRMREIGGGIARLARAPGGAEAGSRIEAVLDSALTVVTGHVRTLEEIPAGRSAESSGATLAALRRQVAELAPDHPARRALQAQLALTIAFHASMVRESDPGQAR